MNPIQAHFQNHKWFKAAWKIARFSHHPHQRMGAVVISGGRILAQSANGDRWGHCAERRAINRVGICPTGRKGQPQKNFGGSTVYVYRSNGRCSRPCAGCITAMISVGIHWVFYIDKEGLTNCMDLRNG